MSGEDAFTVEGVVTEVLSERTCRLKLANGHVVFGFVAGRRHGPVKLVGGQKLWLKLSPYDLSEGRVMTEQDKI
jgi:translation initiation factor IF-1